ncbi:hypothetical protein V8E51_009772 [Hyaloscypha variabilis]
MDDQYVPRRYKPKVRTGCFTCRKRRIKCDEVTPFCRQCTRTGRSCDGYPSIFRHSDAPNTLSEQKMSRIDIARLKIIPRESQEPSKTRLICAKRVSTPSEDRKHSSSFALQTFSAPSDYHAIIRLPHTPSPKLEYTLTPFDYSKSHEQSVLIKLRVMGNSELSTYFFVDFWKALQASDSEPAIRHALIAVSSLYESLNRRKAQSTSQSESLRRFALLQYGKALKDLGNLPFASNQLDFELAIICCMLFVRFEIGQNNYADAMFHFANGMKIMDSRRAKLQQDSSNLSQSTHGVIDDHIANLFSGSLFKMFQSKTRSEESSQELPGTSSKFIMASRQLHDLTATIFQFLQVTMTSRKVLSLLTTTTLPAYTALKTRLQGWYSDFMPLCCETHNCFFFSNSFLDDLLPPPPSTSVVITASLLEIQYLMVVIILEATRQPSRASFTILVNTFERIISLGELLDQVLQAKIESDGNESRSLLLTRIAPLLQNVKLCREGAFRWLAANAE